jgi:hypothetical protein
MIFPDLFERIPHSTDSRADRPGYSDLLSDGNPAGDYHRRPFAVAGPIDEIAAHFGIDDPPAISVPTETIEGSQDLIVLAKDDRRRPLKPDVHYGEISDR